MFSGIVEEMGAVTALNKGLAGTRLTIMASTVMSDLAIGASVSVNGTCLTVVARSDHDFSVDVSPETLRVTTLGTLTSGAPVNLERAMKLNERIGGHLVSGHVDAIGVLRSRQQDGNALVLEFEAPNEILRYCVAKGSITVDGISLTVNDVTERSFAVAIIPHTAKVTTLGLKQVGDQVNLEADVIGKYVERLLQERGVLPPKPAPVIDTDYLKKRGLI
ncbi:riboflavin synthase [Nitrospirales bacterium NOB]|nr:MAG: riboflavin synthase subunit alpha [Nitrospira sp. OLB3]MBV6469326.1 Riboflavin synthase [Nitrospirota bacterium]MCE7966491.1 riboflavin synthase [Nitrospira sp. NTP2]MCK6494222.1 riboflavin synthase [Nitrospira sp.]MDL1889795.1 riboflavin synthase [Nitrospirales bacterium NOB]MEB2339917.1 riboflavin synthase [Nitrospirales bacterium]